MAKSDLYSRVALNEKILAEAIRAKENLERQRVTLNDIIDRATRECYEWSEPQNLGNDTLSFPSNLKEGVYSIIHDGTPVYDGRGKIADRLKKFKQELVSPIADKIIHIAGNKARQIDDNIRNYSERHVFIEHEGVIRRIEDYYINIAHCPPCNDPKMAGK